MKPPKMEFERCKSSLKSHLLLAASASKKFTILIRILQLVTSGEIIIFRTMPLSYIYILFVEKSFRAVDIPSNLCGISGVKIWDHLIKGFPNLTKFFRAFYLGVLEQLHS